MRTFEVNDVGTGSMNAHAIAMSAMTIAIFGRPPATSDTTAGHQVTTEIITTRRACVIESMTTTRVTRATAGLTIGIVTIGLVLTGRNMMTGHYVDVADCCVIACGSA